ncbi:MAG: peptidylprolyl isomerase [Betaproteobacteria bacterium]|nr:peptidylprolyl isomerase [Betaproteobacteria bacterium]
MNAIETADSPLRSIRSLLLERADALGLEGDSDDGRIEALLDREVTVPQPTEAECQRHYERNVAEFTADELVEAAHILFAVTPGVDVRALLHQAENTLLRVREEPGTFEQAAEQLSNCPSGKQGGRLGQIGRNDVVPELRDVLFDPEIEGIAPRLVRSRYGLHVVRIDHRVPGRKVPFEEVRGSIEAQLTGLAWETAARQYVEMLRRGTQGTLGVDVSPLVQ